MAKFQPGQSGNPTGRPKGIKDRRVVMRDLFQPHASELIGKAIKLALSGDTTALRICIDRVVPPVKEEPIVVTLPTIAGPEDCTRAQAAVLNAVAAGAVLPGAGQVLSGLIENQRRAYETTELAARLSAIEQQLDGRN